MKKVVSPSEVAHLWAHKTQTEATNQNRSFYFRDDQIYSYGSHFVIACHGHDNKVLLTTRGYSNTTAKHISVTRSAVSHKDIIFCPYPSNVWGRSNILHWKEEAEQIAQNLTNARKPEKYLSQLAHLRNQVQIYSDYFNEPIPLDLNAILSIGDKEEYLDYRRKALEFAQAEEKRIQAEKVKAHKKELLKWRKFETSRMYGRPLDCDYLRKDSENFETSQGVKIPLAVGLRLYDKLKSGAVAVGDQFLNFTFSEITPKHIKIGCHKITFNEINKVIK